MNPDLEQNLIDSYPEFFKKHGHSDSPMFFGVECGDGWEPIIRDVASKLEPLGVSASQIKEKFGALRIYVDDVEDLNTTSWEYCFNIIAEAEKKSATTCEECGAPGEIKESKYWLTCQCELCRETFGIRRALESLKSVLKAKGMKLEKILVDKTLPFKYKLATGKDWKDEPREACDDKLEILGVGVVGQDYLRKHKEWPGNKDIEEK